MAEIAIANSRRFTILRMWAELPDNPHDLIAAHTLVRWDDTGIEQWIHSWLTPEQWWAEQEIYNRGKEVN
jgi:hypothetical protein